MKLRIEHTSQEFLLNNDSFCDNCLDHLRMRTALEMAKEEAGKIGVHSFITADEFVGESEPGHETTFLHPKDRSKRSGEENALYCREGDEALCKGRALVGDPF